MSESAVTEPSEALPPAATETLEQAPAGPPVEPSTPEEVREALIEAASGTANRALNNGTDHTIHSHSILSRRRTDLLPAGAEKASPLGN